MVAELDLETEEGMIEVLNALIGEHGLPRVLEAAVEVCLDRGETPEVCEDPYQAEKLAHDAHLLERVLRQIEEDR